MLILPCLSPPRPLVVIGPQQQVESAHPIVGVHTRLTDEVEEWKVQKTLQMVREMGAPWIVEFFPWAYMEPVKQGEFSWSHANMVVKHANAQGISVIARLGTAPEWARPDSEDETTTWNYLDREHYADYAAFVKAFVTHFKGRVNHVIIWNEPNLSFEWGFRPVDPEGYAELLSMAYQAAKEADPDIIVLGGALAPTLEAEGSPAGLNDLVFLERMYQAGAGSSFDALAVHAYGWAFPADEAPAENAINFRRIELIRQIMVKYGDEAKHIYITEAGWNDHPRWTKAVSPAQRITYTIEAYTYAEANWPWVEALAMWAFRFPAPQYSYADYFSFVAPDFTSRPIYQAVKEYATP
ncbi:MAG: glycosyl hydrolase 53 family protein [Anaerolineales bacterium]|nr:glycosyl hydrolase 53 family protein [Anaerolineales bacterium]